MSLPLERLTRAYTRMLARHELAERKLARALTQWHKTRQALRRYEKRIDEHALACTCSGTLIDRECPEHGGWPGAEGAREAAEASP